MPLTDVVVTIATPMPGSRFYDVASDYGEHRPASCEQLSYWYPVFVPRGLSAEYLLESRDRFERGFYGGAEGARALDGAGVTRIGMRPLRDLLRG